MATTTSTDNIRLNQIVDNGLNIYGSREKIRNNLIEIAKKYLNISSDSDISKASYLAYLIDMISILTSNQIYYESKIYQEFFIVSAQMNESVQNLAKWIGYSIPKATCATANVLFTLPLKFSVTPANIKFPKFFQVRAGEIPFTIKTNNNLFDSNTSATFNYDRTKLDYSNRGSIVNNSSITIRDSDGFYLPIYWSADGTYCGFNMQFEQCKWEIQTFSIPEDLQKNQFYHKNLSFDGQVADMRVYVCSPTSSYRLQLSSSDTEKVQNIEEFDPNEPITDSSGQICKFTEWDQCVNGIYTISSTSKQYDWVGYYNKGIISFGNGILGKQPEPGSFVVCVLKITKGSDGNVINGTINEGDPLEIELGLDNAKANVDYGVINNNAAYGGVDILTTSEVKNNAIVNLKTRQRLVTDDDYDNIKSVVTGTTLSDCLPILKRSDIKVNEIALYFLMNYVKDSTNEIVPTRNVTLDITDPVWDGDKCMLIPKNYITKVGDLDFQSIFDITLDKNAKMAYYKYTCTNVDGVTSELYTDSVYDSLSQLVYINATTSNFSIDTVNTKVINNTYPLDIKWNINHIPNKILKDKIGDDYEWTVSDYLQGNFEIGQFKAYMITKWDKNDVYTEASDGYYDDYKISDDIEESTSDKVYKTKTYKSFLFRIPNYTDVPQGKQRFELQLMCLAPKTDGDGNVYCIDHDTCVQKIGIIKEGSTYKRNPDVDVVSKLVMEWKIIKKYYSDVTISQDLRGCMQSTVTVDNYIKGIPQYAGRDVYGNLIPKEIYHIHEVPTIYEPYYQEAIKKENSDFELTVLQKLMENVNFSSKRMMTDFTNIKFADTYGPMYNLRYNTPDYQVQSRYSHTPWWNKQQSGDKNIDVPFPSDIARENVEYEDPLKSEVGKRTAILYYIINGKLDEMGSDVPVSSYMGYIAARTYTENSDGEIEENYSVIEPQVGCCVNILDELDKDGHIQTCFWTGHEWKSVDDYSSPLTLSIKVQVDENKVSLSDDALRERIIKVLSEYYNTDDKMGLQKTIDRSEIVKVCRTIDGVQYVDVIEPAFDIKFEYSVDDLKQDQLLEFTPQYVGMRTMTDTNTDYNNTSIKVDIVRK